MTERIVHERRIELAFEEHRFWDARRWKEGAAILGADLKAMDIVKNEDETFTYTEVVLEKRVWDDSKMNTYPIPQYEIYTSNGLVYQNLGW
jgi:fibrillarin-like rRNA methylase